MPKPLLNDVSAFQGRQIKEHRRNARILALVA